MIYSDSAKKKVATYIGRMAQTKLSGYRNSYTQMQLNDAATAALEQLLTDNAGLTGYGAAMDEISREMTS